MSEEIEIVLGEITNQTEDSGLVTRGIRANGKKVFAVSLTGKEWYSLVSLLQDRAVAETDYVEVRASVLWVEKIRLQLAAQGF